MVALAVPRPGHRGRGAGLRAPGRDPGACAGPGPMAVNPALTAPARPGDPLLRISSLPVDDVRKLRGAQLSFIPSNPRSSLDPVRRVGETLVAAIQAHRRVPRNE